MTRDCCFVLLFAFLFYVLHTIVPRSAFTLDQLMDHNKDVLMLVIVTSTLRHYKSYVLGYRLNCHCEAILMGIKDI